MHKAVRVFGEVDRAAGEPPFDLLHPPPDFTLFDPFDPPENLIELFNHPINQLDMNFRPPLLLYLNNPPPHLFDEHDPLLPRFDLNMARPPLVRFPSAVIYPPCLAHLNGQPLRQFLSHEPASAIAYFIVPTPAVLEEINLELSLAPPGAR